MAWLIATSDASELARLRPRVIQTSSYDTQPSTPHTNDLTPTIGYALHGTMVLPITTLGNRTLADAGTVLVIDASTQLSPCLEEEQHDRIESWLRAIADDKTFKAFVHIGDTLEAVEGKADVREVIRRHWEARPAVAIAEFHDVVPYSCYRPNAVSTAIGSCLNKLADRLYSLGKSELSQEIDAELREAWNSANEDIDDATRRWIRAECVEFLGAYTLVFGRPSRNIERPRTFRSPIELERENSLRRLAQRLKIFFQKKRPEQSELIELLEKAGRPNSSLGDFKAVVDYLARCGN